MSSWFSLLGTRWGGIRELQIEETGYQVSFSSDVIFLSYTPPEGGLVVHDFVCVRLMRSSFPVDVIFLPYTPWEGGGGVW